MNITRIELYNFLGYKNQVFDLENYDGLTLITGINGENSSSEESNGAGKSSLWESINWAISQRVRGNASPSLIKDDIIYKDSDDVSADKCKVLIFFTLERTQYKITRTIKLGGKGDLQFHSKVKGEWSSLTKSAGMNKRTGKREGAITRTENLIFDILGCDSELLTNSIFFEQGNTNTFATASVGERESLFKNALSLNKWFDYCITAKSKLRAIKIETTKQQALLEDYDDVDDLLKEKKEKVEYAKDHTKDITSGKNQIKELDDKITITSKKLFDIEAKKQKCLEIRNTIFDNEKKLMEYEKILDDTTESKYRNTENLNDLNERLSKRQLKLDNLKKKIIVKKSELVEIDKQEVVNLRNRLTELREKKTQLSLQKNTDDVLIDGFKSERSDIDIASCPMKIADCGYISDGYKEKKKKEFNNKIFKLNIKKSKTDKQIKIYVDEIEKNNNRRGDIGDIKESNLDILDEIEVMKSELDDLLSIAFNNEKKLIEYKNEIEKSNNIIIDKKRNIEELEKGIKELLQKKDNINKEIKKVTNIEETLQEYKEEKEELSETIERLVEEKTNLKNQIETITDDIKKIGEIEKSLIELSDQKSVINYAIDIMGRDIPHLLVENVIPEIQDYTNNYLDRLSKGKMSLEFRTEKEITETDDDGNKIKVNTLDLILTLNGKTYKYGLYSGGEKTRADIAIHLGYSTFLLNRSGCRLETLWLDEVCSALDKEGKETLISILHELHTDFGFKKIFLISQDSSLKRMVDQQLTIIKTDDGCELMK